MSAPCAPLRIPVVGLLLGGLHNALNWAEFWSVKFGIPGTVLKTSKSQTVSCDAEPSRVIDIPNSYCK